MRSVAETTYYVKEVEAGIVRIDDTVEVTSDATREQEELDNAVAEFRKVWGIDIPKVELENEYYNYDDAVELDNTYQVPEFRKAWGMNSEIDQVQIKHLSQDDDSVESDNSVADFQYLWRRDHETVVDLEEISDNSREFKEEVKDKHYDMTTAEDELDRYTEDIELTNACREYYHNRQRTAEQMKERMSSCCGKTNKQHKRTTIDTAMETLRKEMASLMDLDLSLMKQMLTMNEAIQDLKVQREYSYSPSSSSVDLDGFDSDWSVSETDMFGSDDDLSYTMSQKLSEKLSDQIKTCDDDLHKTDTGQIIEQSLKDENIDYDSQIKSVTDYSKLFNESKTSCYQGRNSFDSGIY